MSETYRCGDVESLVAYLYGECDAALRAQIDAHVVACTACAEELQTLGVTRQTLAAWTPPEVRLGFQITERPQADAGGRVITPAVASWWRRPLPAWAQMAAAIAIFAAGIGVGTARTGHAPAPAPPTAAATTAQAAPAAAVTPADLAAVEQRLRGEIAGIQQTSAHALPAHSDDALLRRVQTMINESEQRQRRDVALQTAQVVRSLDAQRRIDLAQVQRNIGQIQEVAGAAVRGQSQMVNYLMNVSQQR